MSERMRKQIVNPPTVCPPLEFYSQSVRVEAGPLLFVAGQVGVDREGRLVGRDFTSQAEQAFKNIKAILAHHGATFNDVVKMVFYVTDIRYKLELRKIKERYFGKEYPATALVQVGGLYDPECLVEIESIAVLKKES